MGDKPMTKQKLTKIEALNQWASDPDAQWDDERDDTPKEIFRGLIKPMKEIPPSTFYTCGSADLEETPAPLYRLLYLCQPKALDFSDMYKTFLFAFTSLDGRFLVTVEFYKYEVALYFHCVRDCLGGAGTGVISGLPGVNNGWHCTEDGTEFFRLVTKMARREWDVYPGNNFKV